MQKLFQSLHTAIENGHNVVLVSIIASSGSTPRGAGAHMLVSAQGRFYGTIGGGSVEYRAICMAADVLACKKSRTQSFTLEQNEVQDLGMICGGEVTVFFQFLAAACPAVTALAEAVEQCFVGEQLCWLVMELSSSATPSLVCETQVSDSSLPPAVITALSPHPQIITVNGISYYTEQLFHPGRVYIFGGGHVAQALVPVLSSVDFRCVIIEDRPEFCQPELFPGAEDVRLLRQDEWDQLPIKPWDDICIMTRGHKNDTDCQAFALTTPARYIGVIGSRRKIAAVNAQLQKRGFSQQDLARITTPIGLPILAETPNEIAISIAAQLIHIRAQYRNNPPIAKEE